MFHRFIRLRSFDLCRQSTRSIQKSNLTETCWFCQKSIDRSECVTHCPCEKNLILPVNNEIDYFALFRLDRSFELDTTQLTKTFRRKMKLLHPDLFTRKSEKEKQFSQDQSARVNNAYKTLRSPLERAHYLLKLENISIEDSKVQLPNDFLMKIMEINEQLDDDLINQSTFPTQMAMEIRQEIEDHTKLLSEALKSTDLQRAQEILSRLQYFNNINDKLIALEMKHGII